MKFDFADFKKKFDDGLYGGIKSSQYSKLIFKLDEFIDSNKIQLFYPRNLFLEDKELEVFIFIDNKLIIGKNINAGRIEIKVLKLNDIRDLKSECTYYKDGFHRLTVTFTNNETLVFDSAEDTNESWRYSFENHIKELTKFLINVLN